MIAELRAQGLTDWKIATAIGYDHIRDLKRLESGTIPRYDVGETLIALHNLLCPTGIKSAHAASVPA